METSTSYCGFWNLFLNSRYLNPLGVGSKKLQQVRLGVLRVYLGLIGTLGYRIQNISKSWSMVVGGFVMVFLLLLWDWRTVMFRLSGFYRRPSCSTWVVSHSSHTNTTPIRNWGPTGAVLGGVEATHLETEPPK